MKEAFYIETPTGEPRPIVVSCPHSGIELPEDIRHLLVPQWSRSLPDTDWEVHELYRFAPSLGATLLRARFSRYVVDLNRDPKGQKLYHDERRETGLIPETTFDGDPLYKRPGLFGQAEVDRRLALYYRPYHQKLEELLTSLRARYRQVLLIEAHSIKRLVPTIQAAPFADIIIGDQSGKTAHEELTQAALGTLSASERYDIAHNHPFRGGYITRHFGRPEEGIHAIQIEMSQDIYWDDQAKSLKSDALSGVGKLLEAMVINLAQTLERLVP